MKRLISFFHEIMFFFYYRICEILIGKEEILDRLSNQICISIKEDIEFILNSEDNITREEISFIKVFLLHSYFINFSFLKKERSHIQERVTKNINNKINWLLTKRGL